jgi:hypothetical protein
MEFPSLPGASDTVDQSLSFQRMIDTEKTLVIRAAVATPADHDPAVALVAVLHERTSCRRWCSLRALM